MSCHAGPRGCVDGTSDHPFGSPLQAKLIGAIAGTYYFKFGSMVSAVQLQFDPNYYDSLPFCCVFRSPVRSTATVNKLGLNIPMNGLLVQRDTLDIRAAVYFNTSYSYNATDGITADYGYIYRKVMLGYGGGHGIYNSTQSKCWWSNGVGSVGAGYSPCGTFPNDLFHGTGVLNTNIYTNATGIWSHWIYWHGVNIR